jgi:hypothetical protein
MEEDPLIAQNPDPAAPRPSAETSQEFRPPTETAPADPSKPPVVLAVMEGPRGKTSRIFSVVLNRKLFVQEVQEVQEGLGIVATAVDPQTHLAIPAPGSLHPDDPTLAAQPPWIFAVGVREKNGPMLARQSPFFNVRVSYIKLAISQGAVMPGPAPASPLDRLGATPR